MLVRILFGLVGLVALLWIVFYVGGAAALRREGEIQWPYALGSVQQAARTRPSESSANVRELVDLAFQIDRSKNAGNYVAVQVAKGDDAIDPLPRELDAAARTPQFTQLVQVVTNFGRGQWGPDPCFEFESVAAIGAAAALGRARAGDHDGAWEHVRVMWLLASALQQSQWSEARLTLLAIERQLNAIARKLPPPVPAWFAELTAIEPRREIAAARLDDSNFAGFENGNLLMVIFRPLACYAEARTIRINRRAAETMASVSRCRFDFAKIDPDAMPSVPELYRASRIEAELEATAKVLALKTDRARLGRWPPAIDSASRCAENRWIYEPRPDGSSMTLRMSWEVAAEPDATITPALRFAY